VAAVVVRARGGGGTAPPGGRAVGAVAAVATPAVTTRRCPSLSRLTWRNTSAVRSGTRGEVTPPPLRAI